MELTSSVSLCPHPFLSCSPQAISPGSSTTHIITLLLLVIAAVMLAVHSDLQQVDYHR